MRKISKLSHATAACVMCAVSSLAMADIDGWLRKEPFSVGEGENVQYWDRVYVGLNVNKDDSGKFKIFYIGALSETEGAGFLTPQATWSPYSGGLPSPIHYGHNNSMEWFLGEFPSGACLVPAHSKYKMAVGYGALDEAALARIDKFQARPGNKISEEHMLSAFSWQDIQDSRKYAVVIEQDCSPPEND